MNYETYFYADDGFGNLIQIFEASESKYYALFSDWRPYTHREP